MKLVALKGFRNVAALKLKKGGKSTVKDATHDDHIYKGAVIEIGEQNTVQDTFKQDPATGQVIAQLFVSKCVGSAEGEEGDKLVKSVLEEVATDAKREKNAEKLNEGANNSLLVEKLLATLAGKPTAKA